MEGEIFMEEVVWFNVDNDLLMEVELVERGTTTEFLKFVMWWWLLRPLAVGAE
jgi:hypothetical protein